MKKYQFIENDVYFICQRLKEIDRGYFVVYNNLKNKFEVHSLFQKGGTYAFTVPYDALDERTLTFALKTRRENADKIIKEIDLYNQKLQKDNFKKAKNKLEEAFL